MEEPLLNSGAVVDYEPVTSFKQAREIAWKETVKLWRIGGPIAFTIICNFGTNSVSTMFVGHIGNLELSAVSISLSVISTFSFGFLLGMGSALETLCGQAFGAGRVNMLGIYMQRSWIILWTTCIILTPLYCFSAPILKLLGQDADVSDLAGTFTVYVIPQLFSLSINFPCQKFLQAQSKVLVLAWIAFIALMIHIGLLYLFIYVLDWGIYGAAVAYDITGWELVIAQLIYIFGWCNEGWSGFSWLAFKDIWAFVKLSLESAVMLCLEIWYMMSIIILTGHLDNAVISLDSLSICMNVNGWEAMLFIGINAAISVRVSNELGLGRPRAAKYSVYVTVAQSLLIGILCMVIILISKDYFSVIFTSNAELQAAVSKLAWLLGITMVLNSVQPVISGVAIGGGWQGIVAYINLGCYYIFGLPFGFILGYVVGWGVTGIWGGMICGTALQTLLLVIILYRTNWNKEVEESSSRMKRWGGQDIKGETTADSII
uniref:protein TRANSPARENT TESTA 12-like n=1 Tax=Fragaria vesca subsp. vesca TaxID=101020 RepID=UPI0005CB4B6D|nr:PREDICTED: protein TRANSPARENT TESTA 12-like [Fragaria vesca subsp. vesca]